MTAQTSALKAYRLKPNFDANGCRKEVVMTMQTIGPKLSGFLHRNTVQMTATVVVMIAIVLLAWRYVF
jgi:hypothetical protein